MRRPCLIAVLLCLLAPMPIRAAATLDDILAQLRRDPPISERFHDIRYRRALKSPLVVAGTLTWRGGLDFERAIESPYRETGRITGRTLAVRRDRGSERIIPLARAPELQVLFDGLSALFSGDATALARDFVVEIEGDDRWRLQLVPREESLRARVAGLELRGADGAARCLIFTQAEDRSVTVFGNEPSLEPGADFESTLATFCPLP